MAEIEFQVIYDGEGIENGRIPVRDLAPSLLALANLLRDAKSVVNPDGTEIRLEIRETSPGSYEIQLFLLHVGESVENFFYTDDGAALASFLQVVSVLFALIVWAWRHGLFTRERLANGNDLLTAADGDTLEVVPEAAPLYDNRDVREDAAEVMEPLSRDGIDSFKVRYDGEEIAEITSDDTEAFALPPRAETLATDNTVVVDLEIYDVPLGHPKSQWHFHNGEHVLPAPIRDDGFLSEIADRAETFRAGDKLKCRLRTRQYDKPEGGLRAEQRSARGNRAHPHGPRRAR